MDMLYKLRISVLILSGIISISQCCVTENKDALKECVDPLKLALSGSGDVNEVFCRKSNRDILGCAIRLLKNCTELLNDPYLANFKKDHFKAEDLIQVSSADNFCECAPTLQCLQQLVFKNGLMAPQGESPWTQIDAPYACGSKKTSIQCVASSLPECTKYLQHKHPAFTDDNVRAVQKTPAFTQRKCQLVDRMFVKHTNCTKEKSQLLMMKRCVHMAKLYKTVEDRTCGQRSCISQNMEECPADWVEFFIETINVYNEETIPLSHCSVSGAVNLVFSFLALVLSLFVSLY